MTDRYVHDALGEALWLRHGIMRPKPWVKWSEIAPEEIEDYCRQAYDTLRHLRSLGFDIVVASTGQKPVELPAKPTIWKYPLHGSQTMREVRKGPKAQWDIVDDGKEKLAFTMREAAMLADAVLLADPAVKKEPGALTKLSGAFQVFFNSAEKMEPPK